jgi:hypothetical protein
LGKKTDKHIKKIIESCHINFLIGSGASRPFLGTLGQIETLLTDLANKETSDTKTVVDASIKKHYYDVAIKGNVEIQSSDTDKLKITKQNYNDFIQSINKILLNRGTSLISKQVNLFTTNMDLFLDYTLEQNKIAFNDGFSGRLNPEFGTENYNNTINKTSAHYEYRSEVPLFNLFKLHGSVNWKSNNDSITYDYGLNVLKNIENVKIDQADLLEIEFQDADGWKCKTVDELMVLENEKKESHDEFLTAYDELLMINPTKEKFKTTTVNYTFYELLRMYSNYLERENSVLFVFGFSFADEHIREITKRVAKSNPTLTIIIFAFSKEGKDSISSLLPDLPNIKYIYDEEDSLNYSLDVINDHYFKKIAQILEENHD